MCNKNVLNVKTLANILSISHIVSFNKVKKVFKRFKV